MKYQASKSSSGRFANLPQNQGRGLQRGQNFRPVNGEIISADEKSVTVKLPDGGSKIVILSEKTSINKAAEATKEDLKVGEKVAVFGSENTDGSVTAQNIQLNPQPRGNLGQP